MAAVTRFAVTLARVWCGLPLARAKEVQLNTDGKMVLLHIHHGYPHGLMKGLLQKLERLLLALLLLIVPLAGLINSVVACPFCSAVSLTFAQEIAQSQAAVIARLVEPPPVGSLLAQSQGPLPKGKFGVVEVLKGADLVSEAGLLGASAALLETITLENKPAGTLFLLMGIEPPVLSWSSPIPVSERAVGYLKKLTSLPEKGPDRLAFFQHYLEDSDETLARDAYDEFAVAPYEDVRGLESRMDPTQLLEWIENPKIQSNRRRLYATMLGVCGTKADAERIEAILIGDSVNHDTANGNIPVQVDRAELRSGLDSLIACFVTLRGADGLDLIDKLFLERQGRDVPFTETYAAVMALRFLGEESHAVPRARVLESLRILLEEPKLADLVIADLARWQDWSVVDKLVELFEKAEADNIFVREPVVNYLKACPLPEAVGALEKLKEIDPEAVRRAVALAGFAAALTPAEGSESDQEIIDSQDDPGEPAARASTRAADRTGSASKEELALASRMEPVLGDEEATDDRDGIDPSLPVVEPLATKQNGLSAQQITFLKWGIWVVIVLSVGLFARAALRPTSDSLPPASKSR